MKLFGKLGLGLLVIFQSGFAFVYEGKQYIECNTCYFEQDFRAAAVSFVKTNIQSFELVVVNSKRAQDFNQINGNIWSYRLEFVNPGEELPGTIFPRPDIGPGPGPQIEPGVNPFFRPTGIKTGLKDSSTTPHSTVEATRIPVSGPDIAMFASYTEAMRESVYPKFTGHINLDLNQTQWVYTPQTTTTNASKFVALYSSLINETLKTTQFNPFFFITKPLTVKVKTNNDFIVTLQSNVKLGEPEWTHIYTRFVPWNMIVEPSYKVKTYTDLKQIPSSENCEPASTKGTDEHGLICPLAKTPYNKWYVKARLQLPNPCSPFEIDCNDGNGGIIDLGF